GELGDGAADGVIEADAGAAALVAGRVADPEADQRAVAFEPRHDALLLRPIAIALGERGGEEEGGVELGRLGAVGIARQDAVAAAAGVEADEMKGRLLADAGI